MIIIERNRLWPDLDSVANSEVFGISILVSNGSLFSGQIAVLRSSRMKKGVSSPAPWLLPLLLVLGIFYLYPVLDVFHFSITDITLLGKGETYTFDTFINTLSKPELPSILWVTLVFTGMSVLGQQFLGLVIALVVVRGEKTPPSWYNSAENHRACCLGCSGRCGRDHLEDALQRSPVWRA